MSLKNDWSFFWLLGVGRSWRACALDGSDFMHWAVKMAPWMVICGCQMHHLLPSNTRLLWNTVYIDCRRWLSCSLVFLPWLHMSSCIAIIPGRLLVMWSMGIWNMSWDIFRLNGIQRKQKHLLWALNIVMDHEGVSRWMFQKPSLALSLENTVVPQSLWEVS